MRWRGSRSRTFRTRSPATRKRVRIRPGCRFPCRPYRQGSIARARLAARRLRAASAPALLRAPRRDAGRTGALGARAFRPPPARRHGPHDHRDRLRGRLRKPAPVQPHVPRRLPRVAQHAAGPAAKGRRSEEHTSELQSLAYLVCRLLLEKKKKKKTPHITHRTIIKITNT